MVFINQRLAENERHASAKSSDALAAGSQETAFPSRFRFDLPAARDYVQQNLVGQPEVSKALCSALAVVKADIADNSRPLWAALLAGPTGVGKTSSVKLLAKVLTGSEHNVCRIDMNTLSQSHYAAALSGAPPGYVGSKEGVSLFDEALIKGDFSTPGVVLFDEIEKASDEVIQALLNVLEEGRLTLTGAGKTLDFRNCLIFFTTNLGSTPNSTWLDRLGLVKNKPASDSKAINRAVEGFFSPEFYNRLDAVLIYQSLSVDSAGDILDLELEKLNRRLAKKAVHVDLTGTARKEIIRLGFDGRYGARAVRRIVRQYLEAPLAVFLLSGQVCPPEQGPLHLKAIWDGEAVSFTT